MIYKSFSLKNFRGISDEFKIKMADFNKIISIIGNNESGKTTILQGIECIGYLCKGHTLENGKLRKALPKKNNAGFVNVDTTFKCEIFLCDKDYLLIDDRDIQNIIQKSDNTIECSFVYSFKNSSPEGNTKNIKIGGQDFNNVEKLFTVIADNIPDIVYLDDFLFTIPEEILFAKNDSQYFVDGEDKEVLYSKTNQLWKGVLDDIFRATAQNNNKVESIQKDIVDYHQEGFESIPRDRTLGMTNYLNTLLKPWKEMQEAGDVSFDKFVINLTEENNVRRFRLLIEARAIQFSLGERSRGFQWFVCFVLFTQIRLHRNTKGTIFLLDEPASNLHILPQMDILECMQKMCEDNENVGIVYTTHSPFLISIDEENKNYSYTVQNSSDNETDEPKISCYKTFEYDETKHQSSSILTTVYGIVHKAMTKPSKILTIENLKKFGASPVEIGTFILEILKFFKGLGK